MGFGKHHLRLILNTNEMERDALVLWGWQVREEMNLDEKMAVSSFIEKLGISGWIAGGFTSVDHRLLWYGSKPGG